jgi:hypothetical protein
MGDVFLWGGGIRAACRYISLGALFMLIVRRRKFNYTIALAGAPAAAHPDEAFGLPRHHGIFYAVGLAILAEGIFSACFHTCPGGVCMALPCCKWS